MGDQAKRGAMIGFVPIGYCLLVFALAMALGSVGGGGALAQDGMQPPASFQPVDANGVNLQSGGLVISTPAISIGPKVGGLSYLRSYDTSANDVNYIWRDSTYGGVMKWPVIGDDADHPWYTVTVMGSSVNFVESNGVYTPAEGENAILTTDAQGLKFIAADGTVARFAGPSVFTPVIANRGLISSITRPNGEVITYTYTSSNHPQSITNNFGYQIHFEYAGDNPNRLVKVTALNNAIDACATNANTCSFTRNWPSLTFAGTFADLTVTDNLSRTTHYLGGYPLTGIRKPGTVSGQDITVTWTGIEQSKVHTLQNSAGKTWTYNIEDPPTFDPAIPLVEYTTTSSVTDPLGHVRSISIKSKLYSPLYARRVDRITSATNGEQKTTTYNYNNQYRPFEIIQPEGDKVAYFYDPRGNITSIVQTAKVGGQTITTSAAYPTACDASSDAVVGETNYKVCNKPKTMTDGRLALTDFAYSTIHGGLETITQPAPIGGAVRPQTRNTYSSYSAWYKNAAGTLFQAPAVYLPSATSQCQTSASCVGSADETKTRFQYAAGSASTASNLVPTYTIQENGTQTLQSTTYVRHTAFGDVDMVDGPVPGADDTSYTLFDDARQVVGAIGPDPDGAGVLLRRVAKTTYNNDGQVIMVEEGATSSTTSTSGMSVLRKTDTGYDSLGRKVTVGLFAGGATQTLTQYGYDHANRLQCTAVRMNPAVYGALPSSACTTGTAGSDGPDRITHMAYDNADRVTTVTSGYGVDPLIVEAKGYTNNGKVAWVRDGENNRTTYVYDAFDRLQTVRYPVAAKSADGSNATDFEEYSYDANSNRTSLRRRDGQMVTLTYDALNRLKSKSLPNTTYAHDNLGRQTSAALTTTAGVHTVSNEYDALGQLKSETGPLGQVGYLYDVGGRRIRITWPDATYVTYGYYADGGLNDLRLNGSSATANLIAQYAYDNLGRRDNITRGNGVTTTYGYDLASRLNSLSHNVDLTGTANDVTFGFRSNPASQVTDRTISNTAYVWQGRVGVDRGFATGGDNRLLTTGLTGGATDTTYGYDGRGNLTSDGVRTYTYDVENRLTGTNSGAALAYDPLGRLHQTTTSGGTVTRYLYDGPNLIGEYTGTGAGSLLRRYVHGPGTDEPLIWYDTDVAARWLLADHQGSIIAATNGAGTVQIDSATSKKEINTYDEYGLPGASNKGRFQYTGQTWLADVSLYHYKARVYSPTLGRFLQTDPSGYDDGLNWYAYVHNDPLNNIDSDGKETRQVNVNVDFLAAQFKYGRYKEVKTNDPVTAAYPISEGRFTSKGAGLPGAVGVTMEYTICQKCTEKDLAGQSPSKTVTLGVFSVGLSDNKDKPSLTLGFGLGLGFKIISNDEVTLYPNGGKNAGSVIRYDAKSNATIATPPPKPTGCLRADDQGGCKGSK